MLYNRQSFTLMPLVFANQWYDAIPHIKIDSHKNLIPMKELMRLKRQVNIEGYTLDRETARENVG